MEVQGYEVPEDRLYTKEHEWAKELGATILIGITDYAAKTLNDVVYATLPGAGTKVEHMKSMGTVESIKAVSEVYSPISGTVVKVNRELETHPERVNRSPYVEGWLVEVNASNLQAEKKSLMDAAAYVEYLKGVLSKR